MTLRFTDDHGDTARVNVCVWVYFGSAFLAVYCVIVGGMFCFFLAYLVFCLAGVHVTYLRVYPINIFLAYAFLRFLVLLPVLDLLVDGRAQYNQFYCVQELRNDRTACRRGECAARMTKGQSEGHHFWLLCCCSVGFLVNDGMDREMTYVYGERGRDIGEAQAPPLAILLLRSSASVSSCISRMLYLLTLGVVLTDCVFQVDFIV